MLPAVGWAQPITAPTCHEWVRAINDQDDRMVNWVSGFVAGVAYGSQADFGKLISGAAKICFGRPDLRVDQAVKAYLNTP
jgi:hypothetical protein